MVLNPEKMVIKEVQRTYAYLALFGFSCDAVVANRIYPDEIHDSYFDKWKEIQEKYGKEVEDAFYPLPIFKLPLFDREIVGLEMLKKTAEQLFADIDPAEILYRGETQTVVKKGRGYRMTIPLPTVEKEDVELSQMEHELIVKVGNYRRDIILPRVLLGMKAAGASFEDHHLVLDFIPSPQDKEDENG